MLFKCVLCSSTGHMNRFGECVNWFGVVWNWVPFNVMSGWYFNCHSYTEYVNIPFFQSKGENESGYDAFAISKMKDLLTSLSYTANSMRLTLSWYVIYVYTPFSFFV